MPLRPPLPIVLALLAATLVVMVIATGLIHKAQAALAAATFVVILVGTALRTHAPLWRRSGQAVTVTQRDVLRQSAKLIMIAYFWCAIAFYAIYLGEHVHWQHGWEYGTALFLIGIGYALYLWLQGDSDANAPSSLGVGRAIRFASFQAVLIAVGLIWLIASGKLASVRGDWPANQLFLAGGFAIMSLSAILIKTCAALSDAASARSADQR